MRVLQTCAHGIVSMKTCSCSILPSKTEKQTNVSTKNIEEKDKEQVNVKNIDMKREIRIRVCLVREF